LNEIIVGLIDRAKRVYGVEVCLFAFRWNPIRPEIPPSELFAERP
jgi:hypothetical protein